MPTTTPAKVDPALADKLATTGGDQAKPTFAKLLDDLKPSIELALPANMTPDRFIRIALTEIRRNPTLAACDWQSVVGGIMLSAQLGLEIGGPLGQSYLVPFKGKAQFILGYKGIIALARRSGEIRSIDARAVYENDEFEFEFGLDERLVHRPALGDRGKPIAYYAIAKFKDGGHQIRVMSPEDVERHRARSRAKDNGPWQTDYEAMACKTVIRSMAAFLPLSPEEHRSIELDGAQPRGLDLDLDRLSLDVGEPAADPDAPVDAVLVDENGEPITDDPDSGDGTLDLDPDTAA